MKRTLTTVIGFALILLGTNANAAILQQIQIANMLYNQDATGANPGLTTDPVLVKFFTNGSANPCYSATVPFQGAIAVTSGTGQACSAAITTVSFTPVASAVVGTIYNAPTNATLTSEYTQQLLIQQTTKSGNTSYGPIFDTTNGLVTTPGSVTIDTQSHFNFRG